MTIRTRALAGATLLLAPAAMAQTAPSEAGGTRNPATPTVTSYPPAAAGDGAAPGGYNLSRWGEDWRAMCDPAKRRDAVDALKCVKLDDDGDVYVTFSGEARARINHTTNPGLRDRRAQRQDIRRLVAGADLAVLEHRGRVFDIEAVGAGVL